MAVMWLDENSGTRYDVCTVANTFIAAMMQPQKYNEETGQYDDDWPSIVVVEGPRDKYTAEEIVELEAFGAEMTARYDEAFRWRMGCNLIIINKYSETEWMRKRQSWEFGSMWSRSLIEALDVFRKDA